MKIEAPRGTADVLPAQQPVREAIVRVTESAARRYGYGRITTPTFEDTQLFARTSGQGSDVVTKEMYTFEDRGGRSLTLRPEATAPIARAYVEHGLHRAPQPVKTFCIAPMFRYAAPQKGRYREFWQIDFEAMGSDDPAVDAELIELFTEIARGLGVEGLRLELNSIGDRSCRPAYVEELRGFLADHDADLDEDARRKAAVSPLRVFDTKNPSVREVLADAPKIGRSLCEDCRAHFAEVRAFLDAAGVSYELAPTLVRGSRLLHAHRLRVRRRQSRRRAEHGLRRRALRLSDRGGRRRPFAGNRLGSRHRAAVDRRSATDRSRSRSTCSSCAAKARTGRG